MVHITLKSIQKIAPPPSKYKGCAKPKRTIRNTNETVICSKLDVDFPANEMFALCLILMENVLRGLIVYMPPWQFKYFILTF